MKVNDKETTVLAIRHMPPNNTVVRIALADGTGTLRLDFENKYRSDSQCYSDEPEELEFYCTDTLGNVETWRAYYKERWRMDGRTDTRELYRPFFACHLTRVRYDIEEQRLFDEHCDKSARVDRDRRLKDSVADEVSKQLKGKPVDTKALQTYMGIIGKMDPKLAQVLSAIVTNKENKRFAVLAAELKMTPSLFKKRASTIYHKLGVKDALELRRRHYDGFEESDPSTQKVSDSEAHKEDQRRAHRVTVECPECGKETAEDTATCPGCGADLSMIQR